MTVSYEILIILRNNWEKKFTFTEATREIVKYEGEGVLEQLSARRWFEKFSNGYTTLERKKVSGRPLMDIDEVLQEAVESNPSSTRELTRECGESKDTVSHHLLSMGKMKKSN
ncbi:histone-lysine N-methyltransferase SETMAR-like [Halyomorpha halys]|uniref:histone-lysine N-methyltransferase SETMAR-like n=1 Tax=Halyomorpha halys TaxID=286706 RepID=UPI0034D1A101